MTDIKVGGSMEDLQVGQLLVDRYGNDRCVLGVTGRMVCLSKGGEENDSGDFNWYSVKELIKAGFTIKGQEIEEMTLAEVCKELGRTIKIKK